MTALDKACAVAWPFLWDTTDTNTTAHNEARARMSAALRAIREMGVKTQADIFEARDGFVHELDIPAVWTMGIDAILSEKAE